MRGSRLFAILFVSIGVCGCKDTTAANTVTTTPRAGGRWIATIGDVAGTLDNLTVTCQAAGATILTLTQTGQRVQGSFDSGTFYCMQANGSSEFSLAGGTVDGTMDGNVIAIDLALDDNLIHLTGIVGSDSIKGQMSYQRAATTDALHGPWSAIKDHSSSAARIRNDKE
jgi:hypothetical protein